MDRATACEATRLTPSACEPYRVWIEVQLGLGRNAVSIYQDLVEAHGFTHAFRGGKYRRSYLFVMTLKFSGKSFRKVV